jgi:hypothetical protein
LINGKIQFSKNYYSKKEAAGKEVKDFALRGILIVYNFRRFVKY